MDCVVCREPASGTCANCGACCCPKHQVMVGGIAAPPGVFRCPACEETFLHPTANEITTSESRVGVTWFEKFSALWTFVELECQACKHPWPIRMIVFLPAVVLACIGFLLPILPLANLPDEQGRWYKPLVAAPFFALAVPFLAVGVLSAVLAVGVKCLIYPATFAKKCPKCGRRQWRISNFGVAAFRASW